MKTLHPHDKQRRIRRPTLQLLKYLRVEGRKTKRGKETTTFFLHPLWEHVQCKWKLFAELKPQIQNATSNKRKLCRRQNIRFYTHEGMRRLWSIQHSWHHILSIRCTAEKPHTQSGKESKSPDGNQTLKATRTNLRIQF